jgi:hypothetical protein
MSTSSIADGTSMSTVMNLLLIRFGIIAAGIAILAIVAFTVAVVLRSKGKLGDSMKKMAPVARSDADYHNTATADHDAAQVEESARNVAETAADAAARSLTDKGDQQ